MFPTYDGMNCKLGEPDVKNPNFWPKIWSNIKSCGRKVYITATNSGTVLIPLAKGTFEKVMRSNM
jgi:hypothetical protein